MMELTNTVFTDPNNKDKYNKIMEKINDLREKTEVKKVKYIKNIADEVTKLLSYKQLELRHLCDIADEIKKRNINDESLNNKILQYLSESEKNFLETKELATYTRLTESLDLLFKLSDCSSDKFGRTDYFNIEISNFESGYIFKLPPMYSKNNTKRYFSDGKYIYYAIQNAIAKYEEDHELMQLFKTPAAIFVHHVEDSKKEILALDADNIDCKSVIDALQGNLIADDNILSLSTIHFGVLDTNSFCNLYIIEQRDLQKWLQIHTELIYKN